MSIKLIALDLDGTLVTDKTGISKQDKNAIKKARENGIYVCLASGRATKALKPFYDALELDTLTISNGGASITDKKNKFLYSQHVDAKMSADLVRYALDQGYYIQTYTDGEYYFFERTEFTDLYEQRSGLNGFLDKSLPEKEAIDSAKILIIDKPERAKAIVDDIKAQFPTLMVKQSFPEFVEINHPESSKGHALEALGKMLDIDRAEMMAIGDSEIDISMIEYAGIGVAMANGTEHCKSVADYVTADVVHSGVAQAIETFCF